MFWKFLAQTGTADEIILNAAEHFKNPEYNTSQIVLLLGMIGLVVLALLASRAVYRYRLAQTAYVPTGNVMDQARIAEIIDECIIRRIKFEFKLIGRGPGSQITSGTPVEMLGGSISLTMSVPYAPNQAKLAGEKIHCYFRLPVKGKSAYYNFLSEITAVRQGGRGFLELDIAAPDELEAGQKRNFLRISPPEDYVLEAAVWPEHFPNRTDWETRPEVFPEPLLSIADGSDKTIELRDISAGGARFTLDKQVLGDPRLNLSKGARFMLKLVLWDPVEQQELPLWLICRTQKFSAPSGAPKLELGVQFVAWAQLRPTEPPSLRWQPLETEDDEVTPLGNWVAKRYLEHYRKALVD